MLVLAGADEPTRFVRASALVPRRADPKNGSTSVLRSTEKRFKPKTNGRNVCASLASGVAQPGYISAFQ